MLRLTSLGARLVLGVILVAALGLASADVATYASLRSFLFHRTDSALQSSHPEVEGAVLSPRSPGGPGPGPLGAAPGMAAAHRRRRGQGDPRRHRAEPALGCRRHHAYS